MVRLPAVRSLRLALVAVSLLVLTAACTSNKERASFSGGVQPTSDAEAPRMEPSTTTTALTMAQVVPAPDGLGPLSFGTQAARAMGALTRALGRAENATVVPADANCGATRIFRWKDFDVLINEVSTRSGGNPGLVGWSLGATAPSSLDLKTEKGIGIGSTVAAVKAAYGPTVTIDQGVNGPTFKITAPNGVITGELNGLSAASRVKALRAGVSCAA
jgi:hypothetical protein